MISEHFSTVIYTSDQICHCPHTAKGFCLKVIETYNSLPSHKYFKVSFKDLKKFLHNLDVYYELKLVKVFNIYKALWNATSTLIFT